MFNYKRLPRVHFAQNYFLPSTCSDQIPSADKDHMIWSSTTATKWMLEIVLSTMEAVFDLKPTGGLFLSVGFRQKTSETILENDRARKDGNDSREIKQLTLM